MGRIKINVYSLIYILWYDSNSIREHKFSTVIKGSKISNLGLERMVEKD
jgi:hypothetical protein